MNSPYNPTRSLVASPRSQIKRSNTVLSRDSMTFHLGAFEWERSLVADPDPYQSSHSHFSSTTDGVKSPDTEKALPPDPAADGGLVAWTQVFVAFLLVFNGFGYITSFGVFEAYYEEVLPQNSSDIAWIGSMQIFLLFLLGTLSGRALDAGYYRSTVLMGCILQVAGIFATSYAKEYWQIFLSQGIVPGVGNGLLFTPLVWLVSLHFNKRRGLALGLASCGAPVGAVVFTILARQLIPKIGFGWTLRVMGFLILTNCVLINALSRPKQLERKSGPLVDLAAFKELPYFLFTVGMFFALLGLYFAYYYVPAYGRKVLGFDDSRAQLVLIIMSATGILGRLIPPYLADRYLRPLRALVVALFLNSICVFSWIAVDGYVGLIAFVIAYAFCANAVQTLFTASIPEVSKDVSNMGVRIGMVFSVVSFACLGGPPIAGQLIESADGNFLHAQIFGGTVMMLGFVMIVIAKAQQVGWHGLFSLEC